MDPAAEDAVYQWVIAGSGLPADHVIWAGGPVPIGPFVAMRLRDLESPCNGWLSSEEIAGDIVHRISEPGYWSLELTCFHADPLGSARAQAILKRIRASARLPSLRTIFRAGNVGVGKFGRIRMVDGGRSGMFDPRAIAEVGLHVMSEVTEIGAAIERVGVTNEISGDDFSVSKWHSWSNGFSRGFGE